MYKVIIFTLLGLLFLACSTTESTTEKNKKITIPEINLLEIDYYSDSEIDNKVFSMQAISAMHHKVDYPAEARKRGLEGRVVVEALITTTGKAYITNLKQSVHPMLDKLVMKAIKDTDFEPGILNGKRVNVLTSIPIIFGLQRDPIRNY